MRFKRSSLIAVLLCVFSLFIFSGCENINRANNVDNKIQKAIHNSLGEALRKYGTPSIKNFAEMKLAKWIYELRDNPKLVCYWYTENRMTGKLIYQGKCLGYGLPYSVQMVNPEKIVDPDDYINTHDYEYAKLPQPEPNGLYPPSGLSATFLVTLDKNGKPWPIYVEPGITVSPIPLPYAVYPEGVNLFKKKG